MTCLHILPNPKEDRSWTRERWKKENQYCRILTNMVDPFIDDFTDKTFEELILFGYSEVKICGKTVAFRREDTPLHKPILPAICGGS